LEESPFIPVHKTRVFDEVASKIKELIFQGVLKPGDRLPSEVELAHRFGVGRQTIREALRYLELSGFIDTQKGGGGGALVINAILDSVSNSLLDAIQMNSITLHDLTVARLEIERVVARHVIANTEEEDIRALRENIAKAREKLANGIPASIENVQFHKLLARASKNRMFMVIMEPIMAVMASFLARLGVTAEISDKVVIEHEAIVEAIVDRDTDRLLSHFEDHLMEVEKRLQGFC
jgi:GntR family transcriptional repressor for pyruvate dehydrogenase complex